MADPDRSEWLAGRLAAGVASLRAGRPHEAVPSLTEVCDDPEMIAAADMVDIRSRALSLCGQALFQAGRLDEALQRVEDALGLARGLGDTDGVVDIERLRDQIREAVSKKPAPDPQAATLVVRTVAELATEVPNPLARAEVLVRKANAEVDAGLPEAAVETARAALRAAPQVPRIGVLARMTIARAAPDLAAVELQAAVTIARDADEFTLVGLVARAAELAGVVLDAADREPG